MEEMMREKSMTWPTFTEQEIGHLVAYLESVAGTR